MLRAVAPSTPLLTGSLGDSRCFGGLALKQEYFRLSFFQFAVKLKMLTRVSSEQAKYDRDKFCQLNRLWHMHLISGS
jgi:hypothetical protein